MDFLHTTVHSYMDDKFLVVRENDMTTIQVQEKMKIPGHQILYYSQNDIYYALQSSPTGETLYIPCQEMKEDDSIEDAIRTFRTNKQPIVKNSQGIVTGILYVTRIAERLFKAYQHVQAFSSSILHTIDGSCTVIDQNQRVLCWTKGAEKIFSVKQADIIGKPITEFFNPDRLELLNSLNTGTSQHHKQHHAREDLVVLINSNPVYLNDTIIGAVVSETDITSQIRLHNELSNTSKKLYSLEREVHKIMPTDNPFQYIRGSSKALKQTIKDTKKAASTNANILIYGESGVGKELFAKAIHTIREGENAPYIAINCGAIPTALFESEIFGYVSGAFSGANRKGKKGKVEMANGGTLFLDEIGEMPLEMQVKLLRLLQEKTFYPVGGTQEKEADFRVVAATNRDLKKQVETGDFREDLYYRLNVVSLDIPPLRSRPEDIIELTHYSLYEISVKYNRPIHGISQEVMQAMLEHDWPGNIRELKNAVERLVVFSEDGEIKAADLPFDTDDVHDTPKIDTKGPFPDHHRSLSDRLQAYEKEIIIQELEKVNNHKQQCAKNLQITRATLYNRIKKLGIRL